MSAPPAPAKKQQRINIKAFKPAQQTDAAYAATQWKVLSTAFDQIYNKNASNLSFEELYRNAYNLVLYKFGDLLYNGVMEIVSKRLELEAKVVAEADEDEEFLKQLRLKWDDHCVFMNMFRAILMYMDRTFVPQKKLPSVYDMGLGLFRDHIERHARVHHRLRRILLNLVLRERQGEAIDRISFRDVVKMLLDLGVNSRSVYEEDFEKPFLDASNSFYRNEATALISSNTCPEYLKRVARRLDEEVQRVEQYLDSATENKAREVVEREMLHTHMQTLLTMEGSGLTAMIARDQIEDLERMYVLFRRVSQGHQQMREMICKDLHEKGVTLVNDPERCKNPELYVQGLLEMKRKFDRIIHSAFRDDATIRKSVDETFTRFINANKHSPEYLSLYLDEVLRTGAKGMNDDELDKLFDDVIIMFRFLEDKDVFERFYKVHLSKRLLLGRSASDDAERSMISKLKVECGYQLTNKLEGMFNDIRLSTETMENFKKFVAQKKIEMHGVDISVKVLTTSYWPSQTTAACTFPAEIQACCQAFKEFYTSTHSGRQLTWQPSMGSADLKAFFSKKRCELAVTTFQMAILMLYNKSDRLTVGEIRQATAIPDPDLHRHVLSLCTPKLPILTCEGRWSETAVISYNSAFTNKLFKIKVPLLKEERDLTAAAVPADVMADRRMVIDASVVRIMKARRRLEHQQLVSEVFRQLQTRFHPEPVEIKRRIENLIEREYLERDEEDNRVYKYMA